jgi:hypothetical protein
MAKDKTPKNKSKPEEKLDPSGVVQCQMSAVWGTHLKLFLSGVKWVFITENVFSQ